MTCFFILSKGIRYISQNFSLSPKRTTVIQRKDEHYCGSALCRKDEHLHACNDTAGVLTVYPFALKKDKVQGKIIISKQPAVLEIDPDVKNIDTFNEDNRKEID